MEFCQSVMQSCLMADRGMNACISKAASYGQGFVAIPISMSVKHSLIRNSRGNSPKGPMILAIICNRMYIAILSAGDNMGFGKAVGNMAGNGEFN